MPMGCARCGHPPYEHGCPGRIADHDYAQPSGELMTERMEARRRLGPRRVPRFAPPTAVAPAEVTPLVPTQRRPEPTAPAVRRAPVPVRQEPTARHPLDARFAPQDLVPQEPRGVAALFPPGTGANSENRAITATNGGTRITAETSGEIRTAPGTDPSGATDVRTGPGHDDGGLNRGTARDCTTPTGDSRVADHPQRRRTVLGQPGAPLRRGVAVGRPAVPDRGRRHLRGTPSRGHPAGGGGPGTRPAGHPGRGSPIARSANRRPTASARGSVRRHAVTRDRPLNRHGGTERPHPTPPRLQERASETISFEETTAPSATRTRPHRVRPGARLY